jgi:hypothetical protein
MNHQQERSWPPLPGSYCIGGEPGLDAVALVSLRSAVGPLHLRLPVLAASMVIKRKLPASWLEVDFDTSAVRSSAPLPLRRALDVRLAEAMNAVRLETFAVQQVAEGRLRGHADLYAGGEVTEISLDISVVELAPTSMRIAVRARVPRAALGLDGLGRAAQLSAPWARIVIALHATAEARVETKPGAVA